MNILLLLFRRIVSVGLILALVSVITFGIVNVLPGDVATSILGDTATPEQVTALRRTMGLDRPLPQRYGHWLSGALKGDFGISLDSGEPIGPVLLSRLKNSAVLAVLALSFAVPLSVTLGVIAAVKRGGLIDRTISASAAVCFSLPEYVLGLVLILVFSNWLNLLPGTSLLDPSVSPWTQPLSLALPASVVALGLQAYFSQLTRASMIEALESAYVRTAVLKGLPRWTVIIKHALRNALVPTIADVGMTFGSAIGGLVIVEVLFSYPGVGQLLSIAIGRRDIPMLEGAVLMVSVAYGIANLVADLCSMLADPRLRD